MKEKEFLRKFREEIGYGEEIKLRVYYGFDENDNVMIDFDSIREEFEEKLREISNLLEGNKDE
jgi:hypothetical protein